MAAEPSIEAKIDLAHAAETEASQNPIGPEILALARVGRRFSFGTRSLDRSVPPA